MSEIKIQNFGSIKEGYIDNDGWIEIKKVTAFIGNQGSGKSTVAKLISTFTWIEKALVRGDYDRKWFERKNKLKNQFLNYHRLESYLKENTKIIYRGKAYTIIYENGFLKIIENFNDYKYSLPQIMYVPAERNFIAYVKTPKELKLSSDSLNEFLTEYNYAIDDIKGTIRLPINNTNIEYDRLNDVLNVRGEDYKIRLTEASSGFQSLVPLFLVTKYLSNSVKRQSENREQMSNEERTRFKNIVTDIYSNQNLTNEQKRIAISALSSRFNKSAFVNIVEEPEQNLFPESQWEMLQMLLANNNINPDNKLILTTHSPYVISHFSLSIYGHHLKETIVNNGTNLDPLLAKLYTIIPSEAMTPAKDVIIYQLDGTGTIKKLPDFEGIPSNQNYLNETLKKGNILFDKLLEIEENI